MADKKKNPRYVSPIGIASWPKVRTPDTKYNKEGTFSIKLLLDPNKEADAAFLAKLDKMAEQAGEEMRKEHKKFSKVMQLSEPYTPELDKEGNETGKVVVNFTSPYIIRNKEKTKEWKLSIAVFDAKLTPLPGDVEVGGGSLVKVSFESWPYFNATDKKYGITRRLIGVQVLELKQWSGAQDASAFGFEAEEGFGENDEGETSGEESGSSSETADF